MVSQVISMHSNRKGSRVAAAAGSDVFGSMVFWCTYPGSILNRNNLGYSSACPTGTLAFPSDIPRLYSAGYSYCYL